MRFFLISLIFSSYFVNAQSISDLEFGSDSTFDVVSWNIEWFPKNNNTAGVVLDIIKELNADIYALQEIEDTLLLKQTVSNLADFQCHFKSSYYGGLAYVYNAQSVQVNSIQEIYTSQPFWSFFPRSPQVLDCNYNGENYIIINNHLKCCGDGFLDLNDSSDEEYRRLQAITYLKQYIDINFSNKKVILLGDLNDILTDLDQHNVFYDFINDSLNYKFSDMHIAQGSSLNWSYPSWPSHLDHILISNEIFSDPFYSNYTSVVLKIDDYMNGWSNYDNNVSDHRPVAIKIPSSISSFAPEESIANNDTFVRYFDLLGRRIFKLRKGFVLEQDSFGRIKKKYIK